MTNQSNDSLFEICFKASYDSYLYNYCYKSLVEETLKDPLRSSKQPLKGFKSCLSIESHKLSSYYEPHNLKRLTLKSKLRTRASNLVRVTK